MTAQYPPRFLRPSEAAYYAGMGRTLFENEIRPLLHEIQLGTQGIGFDRLDLDEVLDDYKSRNVRVKEKPSWQKTNAQDFIGTRKQEKARLTNVSKDSDAFATALRRTHGMKRKRNTTMQ